MILPRKSHLALILFLLPLALLTAPAQAQKVVSKASYTLTFAAGWDTIPYFPSTDSGMFVLMNSDLQAEVWGVAADQGTNANAKAFQEAMAKAWAQGFSVVDSSSKALGGRTYEIVEMWDSANGDSTSHIRFYATAQGGTLFVVWTAFSLDEKAAVVKDVEDALKTLNLTASIRPLARSRRLDPALEARDILGRTRGLVTQKLPRTPLFQRRR